MIGNRCNKNGFYFESYKAYSKVIMLAGVPFVGMNALVGVPHQQEVEL